MGEKLKVLDLFSGIGGFSLGLERTGGFETTRFCEADSAARNVIARNWPGVEIGPDVRSMEFKEGEADVICAGFPCQDISQAGPRTGLSGSRSGLYREVVRAYRVVRPLLVKLENVVALLRRGMGTVLGDLAASGYDAEWDCIPASHVGAPHIRDRIWIVAYPQHTYSDRQRSYTAPMHVVGGAELFDQQERVFGPMGAPLAAALARLGSTACRPWDAEPQLSRVADGLPAEVAAVKQFGNSLVPRIPEAIGAAILSMRERDRAA